MEQGLSDVAAVSALGPSAGQGVVIESLGVHLQDIPDTASDYDAALEEAVSQALAAQEPSGSF